MAWLEKFPTELKLTKYEIEEHARGYGLDFFDVIFEVVDYRQMNQIAAYGGFPVRYPHWRFGMAYEQLAKGYAYGLQKIYEMVTNNDPCYAYLLRGNALVDQKLVIAHVYGHCDFFKNNLWFARTNRKMMDEVANHGSRVRTHMERHGVDQVESFLDVCHSIEDLIDPHQPFIQRRRERDTSLMEEEKPEEREVRRLRSKPYMDAYVNPAEFLRRQQEKLEEEKEREKRFPESPEKDVLRFLVEHAPLEGWQREILSIVREEAYYFAPQRQTKIMNEGWACLRSDALVFTEAGLVTMAELVDGRRAVQVSDGQERRRIIGWSKLGDRRTVRARTRRGYEVDGSTTHRVLLADGTWRRLDQLRVGDRVALSGGAGCWPEQRVPLSWRPSQRLRLEDVATRAGVSVWTVLRHKRGERAAHKAEVLDALLSRYAYDLAATGDGESLPGQPTVGQSDSEPAVGKAREWRWIEGRSTERAERRPRPAQPSDAREAARTGSACSRRAEIRIPEMVDERLAAFLGYVLSDGNVSKCKRVVSLTTGDEAQADRFAELAMRLFDLKPRKVQDGRRWRVHLYSLQLIAFLHYLGLRHGPCARQKAVPEVILRSPASVVAAFLSAYFDGDGHAGRTGVILSTFSEAIARVTQLILLNFGVLSSRRRQRDGGWRLHLAGNAARVFGERVGFGLERKQRALQAYVEAHRWFKRQECGDEVVTLELGRADVYDITVESTHRYAAQGFVNHNSFWHSTIMTQRALGDAEVVDYAEHHAGTMGVRPGRINPYKLGLELFRYVEDCWNKGKFGPEYEACDDLAVRRAWDRRLGLGRQKIFEVRRVYNDIGFIDAFLTEEFCEQQQLFTYAYNRQRQRWEIDSRDFRDVKEKLLFSLTNFGRPFIYVVDGNYRGRGELLLVHRYEGLGLEMPYAQATLQNLRRLWGRPVHLETAEDGRRILLSCEAEGRVTAGAG
ncbi:MAG: SpoVR family protein [Candidatus Latescibacterota bacterium]